MAKQNNLNIGKTLSLLAFSLPLLCTGCLHYASDKPSPLVEIPTQQ